MPYIDLLTHILPGVDDGPASMDQSVAMAQSAARQGTSTIVATPHLRDIELNSDPSQIRELVADLNSRLRKDIADGGPEVRVLAGMENRITPDLPDRVESGNPLTLNASRFVLLSVPFSTFPPFMDDVITRLRMKRLVPILARPERNLVLRGDTHRMKELVEHGALFVVTSGSITGGFGKDAQRSGLRMIQQHLAHAVVSDMHSSDGVRAPGLRRAFRWVERATDYVTAYRLLDEQPRMILRGNSPEAESEINEPRDSRWRRILQRGSLRSRG